MPGRTQKGKPRYTEFRFRFTLPPTMEKVKQNPPLIHHQGIIPAFAGTGSAALPSIQTKKPGILGLNEAENPFVEDVSAWWRAYFRLTHHFG